MSQALKQRLDKHKCQELKQRIELEKRKSNMYQELKQRLELEKRKFHNNQELQRCLELKKRKLLKSQALMRRIKTNMLYKRYFLEVTMSKSKGSRHLSKKAKEISRRLRRLVCVRNGSTKKVTPRTRYQVPHTHCKNSVLLKK